MTDAFTASNGIQITMDPDRDGKVYLVGRRARGDEGQYLDTHATGGPEGIVALREFFQHERDEELGRWRWPGNPDYVVYPRAGDVLVLFEMNGEGGVLYRRGDAVHDFEGEAARAYFDAHPERKPWQDATDGHLWLIRFDDFPATDVSALVKGGKFIYNDHCHDGSAELNDPTIIAGRRIWPEDAS